MKSVKEPISACRHCHFYESEGRRGGYCQQLGVPVQGSWKACTLAVSPFAKWEHLAEIVSWPSVTAVGASGADPQADLEIVPSEHSLPELPVAPVAPLVVTPASLAPTAALLESTIESAIESALESVLETKLKRDF
jgi:hypothetical protein